MRLRRSIRRDTRGGVLIITALSALILFAVAGAAIDFGKWALVQLRVQQACDAAALAVAIMPNTRPDGTPVSDADRTDTMIRYFLLNYPGTYIGTSIAPSQVKGTFGAKISVSVNGVAMPTSMLGVIGIGSLPIDATNGILATPGRSSDYDLVVVFDETFSTRYAPADVGQLNLLPVGDPAARMSLMQSAMTDYIVNSIFPAGITNPNVRIGFIGYSSHITSKWGLSSDRNHALTAISQFRATGNNYDYVALQAARNMLSGGTGGIANEAVTRDESGNNYPLEACVATNANGVCIAIDSTRNDFSRTKTAADGFFDTAVDTTNIHVPVARTARSDGLAISPIKNVLFITDGDIMTDVSPCLDGWDGRNDGSTDPVNGVNNHPNGRGGHDCYTNSSARNFTQFNAACSDIKALPGAHVFVVNFATLDSNALTAMRQCASPSTDPDYATKYPGNPYNTDFYFAKDAAALNTVLANIAASIKKVKIVE